MGIGDAVEKSTNEAKRPKKLKRGKKAKRPKYSALSRVEDGTLFLDDFPTKSLKPSNTNTSMYQSVYSGFSWIFQPRWIRGWTPLLWAAGNGRVEVVELLLKSDASVEAKTNAGGGPRGIKLGPVGCFSFEDDVMISKFSGLVCKPFTGMFCFSFDHDVCDDSDDI